MAIPVPSEVKGNRPLSLGLIRQRAADYFSLIKPRPMLLVLFTTGMAFWVASEGSPDPSLLGHTLLAMLLVGGGANALNQYLERSSDARMNRTVVRALPDGRLYPAEAFLFGAVITALGLLQFVLYVHWRAALLSLAALLIYVLVYTPLKKKSSLCLAVGALPGAMPPLIGWSAARSQLNPEVWFFFTLVFLWQLPHVMAIWWLYREDYQRGGFPELSRHCENDPSTAFQIAVYTLVLILFSFTPLFLGWAGWFYGIGASAAGIIFFAFAVGLSRRRLPQDIRRFIFLSVVYLPLVFTCFIVDRA